MSILLNHARRHAATAGTRRALTLLQRREIHRRCHCIRNGTFDPRHRSESFKNFRQAAKSSARYSLWSFFPHSALKIPDLWPCSVPPLGKPAVETGFPPFAPQSPPQRIEVTLELTKPVLRLSNSACLANRTAVFEFKNPARILVNSGNSSRQHQRGMPSRRWSRCRRPRGPQR